MFPVHDTFLWARQVPSVIFLVRYGKTRVPLVAKACERLTSTGAKVLGIVVNAAKPGGLTYAPYGYHYDYYYRQYGEPEKTKAS
jgi:Mrp family chromosome partitioning ATPase